MGDMNEAKERLRELLPSDHPLKEPVPANFVYRPGRSEIGRARKSVPPAAAPLQRPTATQTRKAPHQCSECKKSFGAVPGSSDAYCRAHPSAPVVRLCARCKRRPADNSTLVCTNCLQARQLARAAVGGGPDHFGQRKHRAQKHA